MERHIKISADQSLVRKTNQRLVLDAIWRHGPVSRTRLARMLSMSKPAVSDNLSRLLDWGIIREKAPVKIKSGRKPIPVEGNREFLYIFAIDLNYKDPVFAIGNLGGEILDDLSITVSPESSPETRISLVENAIRLMLSAHNLTPQQFYCIGISSPGIYSDKNDVYDAEDNRAIFDKTLKNNIVEYLQQKFSLPVFIKNDANTGVVGEFLYGTGQGIDNLLYLCCGEGIGAGIILNGKLYEGNDYFAGNLSEYVDPRRLKAGKTVEECICTAGLLEGIRTALSNGADSCLSPIPPEKITFKEVVSAYERGDPPVLEILGEIAGEIACMALSLASFLSLRTVIIGGEYMVFRDFLIPRIREVFEKYRFSAEVTGTFLKKPAGLYGVLGIARNRLFEEICGRINPQETRFGPRL
ncbi:ROK family transcriptional regulator [Treponema sp. TIM-1]|uniref:ROK family transcriptional regulator n=1 Tax=Treponema sp. TIM-1 TaxID=2898417 RepID=UPI00397F3370